MGFPHKRALAAAAHRGRGLLRRVWPSLALRHRAPGCFQPYNYTLPDRYPWLFRFAAEQLRDSPRHRLLSFGCSQGDEVFSLRRYFPSAAIHGIDVDPRNIERCRVRAGEAALTGCTFAVGASTSHEPAESYDAIFCLAVLCLGDLTAGHAHRSDPWLRFDDFEGIVTDFARCLKRGGLLLLHTCNFRFCDTAISRDFDTVLEAGIDQLATDVLFDTRNRLMPGVRYRDVGFRKRMR